MESPAPPRILLADDQPDMLLVMRDALEGEGFSVETAADGRQALEAIRRARPDIAVIDLRMPVLDGFAVCRELRADPLTETLPVVILSGDAELGNKIEGLDLGADDFVAKPVNVAELVARLRMILKRTRQGLDANPLTRLPGNASIERRVQAALEHGAPLAVLYVDLNEFKAYNDAYGFEAGDRVIKATAELLARAASAGRAEGDFVGHIGGDDFIVITTPPHMEALAEEILSEFDALAPSFYSAEDRRRGGIVAADRQGKTRKFPLLSMAIGICHNRDRLLASYAQVSQLGAELKKHAKTRSGSACVVDRRRG